MKINKVFIIIVLIMFLAIMALIALNGRYENLTNGYVLDKWKAEVYHVGSEEMPVRINGTINNNR